MGFTVPEFEGQPGPTYAGESKTVASDSKRDKKKSTKLFFLEKFIDAKFTETTVRETNKYVSAMPTKPHPASLALRYPWPPKWIDSFPNFTVALLM
eukprot:2253973-Rhodomonas_salina.1